MLTTDSDTSVGGRTTFNGNAATEATSTVSTTSSDPRFNSNSTTRSYYDVISASSQIKIFGFTTDATASGFTINTTARLEPFRLNRYDLSAGQNYTQTYTIRTTSSPSPPSGIPDQQVTEVTTFSGTESLTVPAGTFTACRFEVQTTTGSTTATSTQWSAINSGISLRTLSGNTDSVLVSATVNGTAITGD